MCGDRARARDDSFLAQRAGRLVGHNKGWFGRFLTRYRSVARGAERFRRLGYGSTPMLARIALADAGCSGTFRKAHAGALSSANCVADRIGRRAVAKRRAAWLANAR